MASFVVSKLISLAANLLIAGAFGAGNAVDAYYAANRVSDTLFNLVAGGALASAFLPVFTTLLVQEKPKEAWKLASAVANLVLLVLIGLSLLAAVFAPWVVTHLLAAGFTDPAQIALTVRLLRIQLPAAAIFGVSGLVMGALNAHQSFLFPGLAPAMYPLGLIFGVEVLAKRMGMGIEGLAVGVVIGASLHLLVQVPALLRLPARAYIPTLGRGFPAVKEVILLMAPRLASVGVVQANFWVNTLIASGLQNGSISALNWAFMLMLMPQAAIAQSIAIAAMPTFSAQVALGKREEMRASLATTLRGLLLLSLPASLGLILLRQPLVTFLFEHGQFTDTNTEMVAWALLWYSAGLVGHSLLEILARAFFSLHDTRTPVIVTAIAMTLNIAFSLLFTRLFAQAGWLPLGGLALANSLATALECTALIVLLRRRLDGLHGPDVLRAAGAAALASLGMGLALWGWLSAGPALPSWLLALGGVALGSLVYAGLLALLRVPELGMVWRVARARIGRDGRD
jgi:putative peptidoglycan lipid II flippase